MSYSNLSQLSKDYIDRFIRCRNMTPEDALKLSVVREVVREYEYGVNSGKGMT